MTRARDLAAGTFELATGGVLKLETSDTTVTDGSVLGKIEFKAPDEASGTDAILVGAAIEAVAEGTFAADNNATELVFKTGASAAADAKMTLDSSGNLLVGMTSNGLTSAGIGLVPDAVSHMYSAGNGANATLMLGRGSNDGNILSFNRSGTTVGSIGVSSNYVTLIGKDGDAGIGIQNNNFGDIVYPANGPAGSALDNSVDLGYSSGRFKDLYLSGGVFLGGTGSANKLSDYEEGTFTPTLSIGGVTLASTSGTGRYTKIGRKVYIEGAVTRNTADGGNGDILVHGLPYTVLNANSIGVMGAGTFWMDMGNSSSDTVAHVYTANGNTHFQGVRSTSTGARASSRYALAQELSNGRPIYFNFSYVAA